VQLTDTVLHIFEWTGVTAIERTGVTAIHAYAADSLWDETREHIVIMGIYGSTLVFVTATSNHILVYTKEFIDSGRWQSTKMFYYAPTSS
jgi:hypothetical protein